MKPLRIEFTGLNSFYGEKAVVDFEALSSSGLFGIFGDTGSGKTTILDAINFALYGHVKRCGGGMDFVNTSSDYAYVDFTFAMKTGGQYVRYEVERKQYRPAKNRKTDPSFPRLMKQGPGDAEFIQIGDTKSTDKLLADILGVSEEDFGMCISLPQGDFAKLINAKPAERTELIERLFDLGKYGKPLADKVKAYWSEADREFKDKDKEIDKYADITPEKLESYNAQLDGFRTQHDAAVEQQVAKQTEIDRFKDLKSKHDELADIKAKLNPLESKSDYYESLRKDLKILPACRSVVSLRDKADGLEGGISELNEKSKSKKAESDAALAVIEDCEKKIAEGNFDGIIRECGEKLVIYEQYKGMPKKLSDARQSLKKKQDELGSFKEKMDKLYRQLERERREADEAKDAYDAYKGDDISVLLSDDLKDSILKAGYEDFNAFLASLSSKIQPYESTESELYVIVHGEISQEEKAINEKISAIPEGTQNLKDLEKRIAAATKKRKELQTARDEAVGKPARTEGDIKALNAQIEGKVNEIKGVQDEIAGYETKLAEVFGVHTDYAECYKSCVTEASAAKSAAEKEKERLEKLKEKQTGIKNKADNLLSGLKGQRDGLSDQLEECKTDLKEALSSSTKASEEECRAIADKYAGSENAESDLTQYDQDMHYCVTRKEELLKTDGVEDFDESILAAATEDKKVLDGNEKELAGKISDCERDIKETGKKLAEKEELEGQLKEIKGRLKLATDLSELLSSGKFAKFIANEYLGDICTEASKMLLDLSNGRFWLTYDKKSEKKEDFILHDNFDAKKVRIAKTLSGGETFLASLSLALTLSRTISERSNRTIEFFFLDEGFGSLDAKLCDEVMAALQNLRTTYPEFTIGVISHVESLIGQIDNHITVEKATDTHGSRIHVS